jgi:hypothetical protein
MSTRNEDIKQWRPLIKTINEDVKSNNTELFQNEVLRPILKFQNDLLLALFIENRKKYKVEYKSLSPEQQLTHIETSIKQDSKFRSLLVGTIVGLFTIEEHVVYSKEASVINKRIINMLVQRLQDQLHLLQ